MKSVEIFKIKIKNSANSWIKVQRFICIYAIHIAAHVLTQWCLLPMFVWYSKTSVDSAFLFTSLSLIPLCADYAINGILLRRMQDELSRKQKKWAHLPDLVLAVPGALIAVVRILKLITRTGKLNFIGGAIAANILILSVTALLVIERMTLIRK